jgi:putative N-acetyltransferase (TIGR04045 family)
MSFHRPQYDTSAYCVKLADTASEHAGAAALRHAVFCEEQGVFENCDRDEIDTYASTIVAHGPRRQVIGTVRIHEDAPRLWWGSRLAVARDFRRVAQLGAGLIRLAVSTANARGCDQFLAHVQAQNERLFQRLNWDSLAYEDHHGIPHVKMQADLASYPAGMEPLPAIKPVLAAE